MKKKHLFIIALAVILGCGCSTNKKPVMHSERIVTRKVPTTTRDLKMLHLATAMALVESKDTEHAVSKNGKYKGWLQMGTICVREVCKVSDTVYSYNDRLSIQKSFEMFSIIMNEKNPTLDIDRAVAIWNPGVGNWYNKQVKSNHRMISNGEYQLRYELILN